MLLNQQEPVILNMDIIDAMSYIQAAASLRKSPNKANKKAFPK